MSNILLIIVARLLYLVLYPLSFGYVVFVKEKFQWKRLFGYWKTEAINLDRYGNYAYRSLFNRFLRNEGGYEFGNFNETISTALQRNYELGTLSKIGIRLYKLIDRIDKGHFEGL